MATLYLPHRYLSQVAAEGVVLISYIGPNLVNSLASTSEIEGYSEQASILNLNI
ncbi:hypothetical protein [Paucibacter sp. B2R-40]|uniref:hypothetical protein n=1 Tax=Paucibacter sp. B2R-40 TaxID=2893554 RepID=UPI0021E515C7|nr:hypothetical protein [Paucibacter sp. B2R-40]